MADPSTPARFRPEMPQIPGLRPRPNRSVSTSRLSLVVGLIVFGVLAFLAVHWFSHPRHTEPVRAQAPPQSDVPPPIPDPSSTWPHATESHPVIGEVSDLAKPWAFKDFYVRNPRNGEEVVATILRLPGGAANLPSGYWAFSRKAPYSDCQLEYISDLAKLKNEYGFKHPVHPLVGNPCSRTLFDPLKTVNLPGNVWIRGAVIQGSDLRPPFGVEIRIDGKQILALRTE